MTGVLHMMLGAAGIELALTAQTLSDSQVTSPACSCGLQINRAGTITNTGNGSDVDPTNEWVVNPVGNPGDNYHVRLIVTSGTAPNTGDAVTTWHALTSDRSYLRNESASTTGTWRIDISGDGGTTTLVSATMTYTNTYIP